MARLFQASGDWKWIPTVETSGLSADGWSPGTTAAVSDATIARSVGGNSIKCVGGTTATSFVQSVQLFATNTTIYTRVWMYCTALPTQNTTILGHTHPTNGVTYGWVRLTPSGNVELWKNATTPVQIGSASTETVSPNTWFCIHTRISQNSIQTNQYRWLWLNDELVASESGVGNESLGIPAFVVVGWYTAPGTTATMYIDDWAINNVATGAETGRPRSDGRVLLLPVSRVISNTGWSTCENTTTDADILQAVTAFPPAGHSDVTNHTTSHQIRNITAAASTAHTDAVNIEFECQSFGRAGVGGNVYLEPGAATYSAFGNTAARTRIGQGFYMNGTLELPRIWLRKVGSPTDNVTLSLCTDSSGVPSGTVLQTATIDGSTLTTTAAPIDFAITPEPLTPKAKYWLELKRSGANDAANYYEVETCASGLYYDGGESLYNASWGAATATVAWHVKLYSTEGAAVLVSIYNRFFHGEGAGTGTKFIWHRCTNPTYGPELATVGSDLGAAGTFPTNWSSFVPTAYNKMATALLMPNAAIAPRPKLGKGDTGTRSVLVCAVGVDLEWQSVENEWLQFTKIAGGVTWYGKHCAGITHLIRADDTELTIDAGDWIMTTALLNEGENFNAGTTSVTDATLRTDYTYVGPAG